MSGTTQVQVDEEQRILLSACTKPGEVYAIETPQPGEIILRLVGVPGTRAKTSFEDALRAVRESNLEFSCGYDELRALTREA